MDQVVAVALPEGVEHGGLVEESELSKILDGVEIWRVSFLHIVLVNLKQGLPDFEDSFYTKIW